MKTRWHLQVRPARTGASFQELCVHANSDVHAISIARRYGLEVDKESVRPASDTEGTDYSAIAGVRGPVDCRQCGYLLHGLAIDGAVVECPECGFPQVLISFDTKTSHLVTDWLSHQVSVAIIGLLLVLIALSLFQMII